VQKKDGKRKEGAKKRDMKMKVFWQFRTIWVRGEEAREETVSMEKRSRQADWGGEEGKEEESARRRREGRLFERGKGNK